MGNRILRALLLLLALSGCSGPSGEETSGPVAEVGTGDEDDLTGDPIPDRSNDESSTGDLGVDLTEDTSDTVDDPVVDPPEDSGDVDDEDFGGCVISDMDAGETLDLFEEPDDATDVEADTDITADGDAECADSDTGADTSDVQIDTNPDTADLEDLTDVDDTDVPPFPCGDSLPDSRDGKTYGTVLLGAQCWMAQNLNVGDMILGTVAQQENSTIEKYCYDDTTANCDTHGGLYQWNELMDYSPSDSANPSTTRGICPVGWHVPSDQEWQDLEMHLGMSPGDAATGSAWRGAGVGTALKVGGSSSFDATLAGRRSSSTFSVMDLMTYFYTSTDSGANAWRRCLHLDLDAVGRYQSYPKSYALSVRCVAD